MCFYSFEDPGFESKVVKCSFKIAYDDVYLIYNRGARKGGRLAGCSPPPPKKLIRDCVDTIILDVSRDF